MSQPRILYRHGQPVSAQVLSLVGTRTAAGGVPCTVWAGSDAERPTPASPAAVHVLSTSASDQALVAAVPETATITLAGSPVVDDTASVSDGTHTYTATYAAGTLAGLAADLAAQIDGQDGYTATAVGVTVHVSGPSGYTLTDASAGAVTCTAALVAAGVVGIAAGTGARQVAVHYLDHTGKCQTETIALQGTTAVTSVAVDIAAVQSVTVTAAGSGGAPAGDIKVQDVADAVVLEIIKAGVNRSESVAYTVPSARTGLLDRITLSPGNSTLGRVRVLATALPGSTAPTGLAYVLADQFVSQVTVLDFHESPLGPFPAGTQIYATVKGDGAIVSVDLTAHLEG